MVANIFYILSKLTTAGRWFLLFVVLLSVIVIAQPLYQESWSPPFLSNVSDTEKSLTAGLDNNIKKVIPTTHVGDKEITPFIRVLLLLIVASWLKTLSWKMSYYSRYIHYKIMLKKIKSQYINSGKGEDISHLESKLEEMRNSKSQKDSINLFENFIQLKEQIDKLSRHMTFLSVDIVDSTGMKVNEDKLQIQYDFLKYKKMLQGIFDEHKSIKSAWTPDGVMVAFDSPQAAISAAKKLFVQLDNFNKNEKSIKRDFILRCGINAGIVYYDATLPLEEMTDQVIDIAGHMQKHADPDTIAIPKTSAEPLAKKENLHPTDKIIDDLEVYEWNKNNQSG